MKGGTHQTDRRDALYKTTGRSTLVVSQRRRVLASALPMFARDDVAKLLAAGARTPHAILKRARHDTPLMSYLPLSTLRPCFPSQFEESATCWAWDVS